MLCGMSRRRGEAQFERTAGGRALGGRGRSRRARVRRRRLLAAAAVPLVAVLAWQLSSSAGGVNPPTPKTSKAALTRPDGATAASHPPAARVAAAPHVSVSPTPASAPTWTTVARVHGQPGAWLEQAGGVTLMRFDQRYVHLTLHA